MDSVYPQHRMDGIVFGIYDDREILELSIKEITNPQTFDTFLHPTPGGLYDSSLGPSDRDEICSTCGMGSVHCPGHMGHIRLPLPVFNPVFFRTLFEVLRGTCFACHRLFISGSQALLLMSQIKALDEGCLETVEQLSEAMTSFVSEHGADKGFEDQIELSLNKVLDAAIKDNGLHTNGVYIRHIVDKQSHLLKEFVASMIRTWKKCPHCGVTVKPLRVEHNSKIFFHQRLSKNVVKEDIEETALDEDNEGDKQTGTMDVAVETYLTPTEARKHLRKLWNADGDVLQCLYGALKQLATSGNKFPTDIFFSDVVLVPPTRFRPLSFMNGRKFENPQTATFSRILKNIITIKQLLIEMSRKDITEDVAADVKTVIDGIPGTTANEKLQNAWVQLQFSVNCVIDSNLDRLSSDKQPGIKQLIEKKEGLFRKHMMGKRVNFAARSVISPDPYINTNEIGVPLVFAKKLTYSQAVTPWNVQELRQCVINGPNTHPGAAFIEDEDGNKIRLSVDNKTQREAIAKLLLTPSLKNKFGCKKVLRHIHNGDVVLMNRQPSLHKPSIQAHKVRVLQGEKTLRLHYSNCKAYNADFDGDEMNLHFLQNDVARAEAYELAMTDNQYLVPKDGTPLGGLIQDHIVSGVNLTVCGRFFNRNDYMQLVFNGLTDKDGQVVLLPPSILKPINLWSGKQVLSTLLLNIIPDDKIPLTLHGKSKIPSKLWLPQNSPPRLPRFSGKYLRPDEMTEFQVIIRDGELLCGVLDKAHFGPTPYSMVHCCYELYGGAVAGKVLTGLARLFTSFLQVHRGFTLGVEDILVKSKANKKRRKIMKQTRKQGNEVAKMSFSIEEEDPQVITNVYQEAHFGLDDSGLRQMDFCMKTKTDDAQNQIAKCIGIGLYKQFPSNNLQLMVQAGAKGSKVNCMQISCLLGQIELEGCRPPLMVSGRSLPSFLPYDTSPRSGGYIDGRFLTGIRPQEYFFHCMAGREGLVDTAVKTSRSGYLQRCLVKHLEGLMVNYDLTVRDSDGSVIQFQYGEDSLNVQKTPFLNKDQFPFLVENKDIIMSEPYLEVLEKKIDTKRAAIEYDKMRKYQEKYGIKNKKGSGFLGYSSERLPFLLDEHSDTEVDRNGRSKVTMQIINEWRTLDDKKMKKIRKRTKKIPDPVNSFLQPDRYFGSLSNHLNSMIDDYTENDKTSLICDTERPGMITKDSFKKLLSLKFLTSLTQPGDGVGLIAAQSIGEPSTQMTLNTFHFAGRGEMNVTLGIPRLREILMVASLNIKTPSMEIPILTKASTLQKAKILKQKLQKLHMSQIVEFVNIKEHLSLTALSKGRYYKIYIKLLPLESSGIECNITQSQILQYIEKKFVGSLIDAIKKYIREVKNHTLLKTEKVKNKSSNTIQEGTTENIPETVDNEDSEEEQQDDDSTNTKLKKQQMEEVSYEGEEEEMEEVGDVEIDDQNQDEDDSVKDEELDKSDTEENLFGCNVPLGTTGENKKKYVPMDDGRRNAVISIHPFIDDYTYDSAEEEWCEITLKMSLIECKLDLIPLIESQIKRVVLHSTHGINRCFLSDSRGITKLKIEGVNILEMYNYDNILELRKLYCNDIHAVARTFGIEAARSVIVTEVRNVFAAYGIHVDFRHLSLVADYMTFEGIYRSFNRFGIESNASPLQKVTFETSMQFLKHATIGGSIDQLKSPSARIVTGRVVRNGTGCFDIMHKLV